VVVLPAGGELTGEHVVASTEAWDHVLARLARTFDVVLVNTPPLLEGIEASLLVAARARTLLVVNLGRTRRTDLDSARRQLDAAGADFVVVQASGVATRRHQRPRAAAVPRRVETFANVAEPAPDDVTPEPLPGTPGGNDNESKRKRRPRPPAADPTSSGPQRGESDSGPPPTDESNGDAPVKPKRQARVTRPAARTVPAKRAPRRARTETVAEPVADETRPEQGGDGAGTGEATS
jgi:hypothetical protein